ncbi:MAG TPA: AcvB/VirJ family lysyl-phosphatidylglycerol hydrolase [Thermoanaerobaculia bacterium]|jgi:type IV secretory pathway VirJ component
MQRIVFLTLLLPLPALAQEQPRNRAAAPETLTYGRFGQVTLYRRSPHPSHVVLFLSGDGGWNQGVVDMAQILAGMDSLVAGISVPHYLRQADKADEKCTYAAADLEMLSKLIQRKLGFPAYVPPVLVGYSSGATLAYAVLVQAPPNTFQGAISMGFCPDLPLRRPFCPGHGLTAGPGPGGKGFSFLPAKAFENPWIALQGDADKLCSKDFARRYTAGVPGAELVMVHDVGHGFSKQARWVPQFKQAFLRLVGEKTSVRPAGAGDPGAVEDLPLVEVPARGTAGDALAVILSGDGGWAGLDREVAGALAGRGVPVVGLNSLQYFWTARTPEGAARDLERLLRHYLAAWKRRQALLIGYSLGADVLPFLANRLPADLLDRVRLIVLLGPSRSASFEFHLGDWLGVGGDPGRPVLPEVRKLNGLPLLCLYGKEEDDSLCPLIVPPLGKAVALAGAHHFGGRYDAVADLILAEAKAGAARGRTL